jgi:ABC-2 type transport system permease protein
VSADVKAPGAAQRSGGLSWYRVRTVMAKEWAESRRNKMIVWTTILIPFFIVALVLGTDFFMARAVAQGQDLGEDELPTPTQLQNLPADEAFIIQMNEQYTFYLFMIPMMLPVYIAAYTIIGEKQTKTLEPLLATPISTSELLVAKALAATSPAVVVTWLSYGVMVLGLRVVAPLTVFVYSVRAVWIVAMILLSPLLAFLSVLCGVIVSSRINDPRAAQQITGVFIIPIVAISLVVLAGKIFVGVHMVIYAALVALLIDLVALYFAVRVFQRETILTRWK